MTTEHDSVGSSSQLSRRNFLSVTALAGASTALAACGGGAGAPGQPKKGEKQFGEGTKYTGPNVKLAFWNGFTGGDGPFMRKMVDQFNQEHDNIKVAMNVIGWADYYTKVPNSVASGSGPDVGIMHVDQLGVNAARQVLIPLDEVADALKLQEADFQKQVWQAGLYKDQRYGIPLDIHPLGFWYNKTHLEKAGLDGPPQDNESYTAAVQALQQNGVKQPWWITATWPGHLIFFSLLHQFGGTLYEDETGGKATFASDAGVEALEWYVSWIQKGATPRNVAGDAQAQAFRQQRNSLTWDGIWMMNEWAKIEDLQWGAAAIPQIGDQPGVWGGSHNFIVTRQAQTDKNKLAASRAFIAWISERSVDWAKAGQIPARNTVRDSSEFQALEVQATLEKQLDNVHFFPGFPGAGDITGPTYEQAVNQAVLGKASPREALTAAAKKADSLLAAAREKYGA